MKEMNKCYFYNLINRNHFSKDTMVKVGCTQLLDFLFTVNLDCESSFHFEDLRSHVDEAVDDEDFIYSVFYLCRKDINILQQEFSVWNNSNGIYDHFLEKNLILEMLRDRTFYNPISGEDLNESQFAEEILTFFTPTKHFLEMKGE